jgi:hypothetical protein
MLPPENETDAQGAMRPTEDDFSCAYGQPGYVLKS